MPRSVGIFIVLILVAPLCAFGQAPVARPNWDATQAMRVAKAPASESHLEELFALKGGDDKEALLRRLDAVIAGTALAQPVRDGVLFHFAVGLADFDEVDPAVIERLRSVTPLVLVPHEEHSHYGVPLFDIAGAANGVYALQLRRKAREQAVAASDGSPDDWLAAYSQGTRAERKGYQDALAEVPDGALAAILQGALQRLGTDQALTPVAGKSALLLQDSGALQRVVRDGAGSELASILEAAGLTLGAEETLTLLQFAVHEAPAHNAALAIAQLFPPLAANPVAIDLLLDLLRSPDLGATAALALASAGGPDVLAEMRTIAQGGDSLAAARARTALGLRTGGRP